MSGQQPPRRRRIAGESKPGAPKPGISKPGTSKSDTGGAGEKTAGTPQARRPQPARPSGRPVIPTPQPAPRRGEPDPAEVDETPAARRTVSRPSRPARPTPAAAPAREREQDDVSDVSTATSRTRPPRRQALAVLAVVVGLAAVAGGYWYGERGGSLDRADAGAAADAAAEAVQQVLSFDYRDLDAYESGVDGLLTDDYVTDELEPSLEALREQAPSAAVQVETTVHAAATETCRGECPAGEATVLVVVDKVTLTANLETPTVTPQRLRVSMVETDGRWLVDAIQYVGS